MVQGGSPSAAAAATGPVEYAPEDETQPTCAVQTIFQFFFLSFECVDGGGGGGVIGGGGGAFYDPLLSVVTAEFLT